MKGPKVCVECRATESKRWSRSRCRKCYERWYREHNPETVALQNLKGKLKLRFNLTLTEYTEMLLKQGGVCAICRQPESLKQNLAVDHNHQTGKVRGLLCFECNTSLGKFNDSVEKLRAALAYLEAA